MLDTYLADQLTASRLRWVRRVTAADWHEWVRRTASNAFRGRAPELASLRIHSLPGHHWEVLLDGNGRHHLVADDELNATLAELSLLSLPGAPADAGYDKSILMLADAFRSNGDLDRYAVCMGWALPRAEQIRHLRRAAFQRSGNSAETMVVLLHEIAHRVVALDESAAAVWRDLCALGVDKVVEALSKGGHFHGQAVSDGARLGLQADQAEQQVTTYLDHLRGNKELLEELTCDLLAVLAFLNLNTPVDVISDPEGGPTGMTTKQVGDALLVAHGAIQNLQLVTTVQTIAASASAAPDARAGLPDRSDAELTARSSVLAFVLSTLLQAWCDDGNLRAEWPGEVPAVKATLLRSIKLRNDTRTANILNPLQELDGTFHEPERYATFESAGLRQLREASIAWPGRRKPLDAARWSLTLAPIGSGDA